MTGTSHRDVAARRLVAVIDTVVRAMDGGSPAVERALSEGDGRVFVQSYEMRTDRFVILRLAESTAILRPEISKILQAESGAVLDGLDITSPSNVPARGWGDLPEYEVLRMPWGKLSIGSTHASPRVRVVILTRNPPRPTPRASPPGRRRPFGELLQTAERAAWPIWENLELSLRRDLAVRDADRWEIQAVPVPMPASWPPTGSNLLHVEVLAREGTSGREHRTVAPFARAVVDAESGWISRVEPIAPRLRDEGLLALPESAPGAPWDAAIEQLRKSVQHSGLPEGPAAQELRAGFIAFARACGPLAARLEARHPAFFAWLLQTQGVRPSALDEPLPFAASTQPLGADLLERVARRALHPLWRQADPGLWFVESAPSAGRRLANPPLKTVDGWTLVLLPLPLPRTWPPRGDGLLDFVGYAMRNLSPAGSEETAPFGRATFDVRIGRLLALEALRRPGAGVTRAGIWASARPARVPRVIEVLRHAVERTGAPVGEDADLLRGAYRWLFASDSRLTELCAEYADLASWADGAGRGR